MPSIVLPVLNHILRQNPAVCRALSGYNGLVAAIESEPLNLNVRINRHGLLETATRRPDTVLVLHRQAVARILSGKMPAPSDFSLRGDAELGFNLIALFSRLHYHARQDLQQIFGTDIDTLPHYATQIGHLLTGIGRILTDRNIENTVPEKHTDLTRCLIEIDSLHQQISLLNDNIAQLNARLDR